MLDLKKEFQKIPGVGKSLAKDFTVQGVQSNSDLKDRDPEKMYRDLCKQRGVHIDRCVLYVFRCAVYFACEQYPKPTFLKWSNGKDDQEK